MRRYRLRDKAIQNLMPKASIKFRRAGTIPADHAFRDAGYNHFHARAKLHNELSVTGEEGPLRTQSVGGSLSTLNLGV
jgi:hypothetical protein